MKLVRLAALLLTGCTAAGIGWDEIDYCGDPPACTPCGTDSDCVASSSCCAESLYCSHTDDVPIVCQLGCVEPTPPPCRCVEGRCRFD